MLEISFLKRMARDHFVSWTYVPRKYPWHLSWRSFQGEPKGWGFCTCTGRPKCVLCECLGLSSNLGNAVIFRAIFVRKKPRHQSALAYALAKAEVEELKPGAVLSQRTKRTPFMQEIKSETDCLNLHSESHFVQTFLLRGHVSDSYMSHKNCNLYSYSIYDIIMTSVQQNRKRQSAGKLLQKSYTKLYQVLANCYRWSWSNFSCHLCIISGSRQLLASHFTFDPAQGVRLQLASNQSRDISTSTRKKKGDDICEQKLSQNSQNIFIMCLEEEKKRNVFYFFVCAYFWCCKTSGFFSLLEWSHFHAVSHHRKGDIFGALCVGATLVAPRRAAVLGALQDTPSEDM